MLKDQTDLLLAFNTARVRYLLIGGYALGRYTEPRTTRDLEVLVDFADVAAVKASKLANGET